MNTDTDTQTEQVPIVISLGDIPPDADVIEVPLISAFNAHGPCALIGDLEPENCDHAGAAWSNCLALRCWHCGSKMFMPPRFLAYRPEYEIDAMHEAWERAGWPAWRRDGWNIKRDRWTIISHPLFNDAGGLAVRNDRLNSFPMPDEAP